MLYTHMFQLHIFACASQYVRSKNGKLEDEHVHFARIGKVSSRESWSSGVLIQKQNRSKNCVLFLVEKLFYSIKFLSGAL